MYLFIHHIHRIDINSDIKLFNLKPEDEVKVRSADIKGNE